MKTLVIYDNEGFILSQMSGAVREPIGVNFLYVDIPNGKILKSIDTTKEEHVPVYEDLPRDPFSLMQEQVNALTIALAEVLGV